MKADLKDLFPNLTQWQKDLLDLLQKRSNSENPLPVYRLNRRTGKSWTERWLRENLPHLLKQSDVNFVVPQHITKELISTSALKSKQKTLDDRFIIWCDEMDYPIDDELYEKLKKITDKMKKSVASTPKSEYNIFTSSGKEK